MSFMFNPFPYDDPVAVNNITNNGKVDLGRTATGNAQVAALLGKVCKPGTVIGVDGYTAAPFGAVVGLFGADAELISVASIYKSAD